ncbi:methyltransferase [Aeromonas enteropelogenes]|uniref:methyltransferase n=1 Tax=Aeromonas enteropelogenes TaxID=29489 RepID=UPI0005A65237|nr:class I SAM-dependent methyltransferase [Aeromonas enteropelogenes]MCZ0753721.1 class I SAM-dependent methyltransferase [Aeromonas enteropelogenes]UBH58114.1 class I SAM-dependent methyltransferase [Aeromonas enteropelogenes]UCA10867.1 class I SAM-dependent methyltransferase [Aeromonas enteropelogenes]
MNHYHSDSHNALDAISQAQRIAFAPMLFQAAWSLRETGILASLAASREGATVATLAHETGLTEYAVGVLLDMGLGGGICYVREERYHLGKVGQYLLSDPMTRVNMDFVQHVCYKPLAHLQQAIESGTPAGIKEFGDWQSLYPHLKDLPEPARGSWFRFDHFYSDWAFKQVQDLVFGYEPRHLYDLGGNTGKWALSCARRNPELEVTILDLPEQIAMADEQIREAGLAGQVRGYPVNLLEERQLPGEADIWWMSQFLDCFGHDEIVALLRRIRRSMKPGARLCILELFWDRQPFEAASFSLNATSLYFTCLANGNSRFYHSKELYQCLREAEFHVEADHDISGPGHTLLVATPL